MCEEMDVKIVVIHDKRGAFLYCPVCKTTELYEELVPPFLDPMSLDSRPAYFVLEHAKECFRKTLAILLYQILTPEGEYIDRIDPDDYDDIVVGGWVPQLIYEAENSSAEQIKTAINSIQQYINKKLEYTPHETEILEFKEAIRYLSKY